MIKIGHSRDIHRLEEGRPLILGGVRIPHEKGLLGHSDADALLHAVAEAIIGALGKKDLGTHFPDTDPRYKGISSLLLLSKVYEMLEEEGFHVVNIDSLIMIEKPKMAPYIERMKENIAHQLHILPEQVNVKATRGEGLGFVGEEKGVEADAVVLLGKNVEL